jgi:predicted nucleotidyltransferase
MLLRDKDRRLLEAIFLQAEEPIEVWAYGSRVLGTAHEGSDLDLVVRTPNLEPLASKTLKALREAIRESNIPIWVELHDWARLPASFQKNIEARYEPLYTRLSTEVNEPQAGYGKGEEE